ncbi:hypothetical protein BF93_16280 [Brachybacterium phenoliresistens]|uniref:Septum formation-related domain-containing protein n=1 Tax=Brachybacterium phenoliresistens TaxID=396014 RepID=Z9JVC9_9MICO|nr:hypothetical protein [Brachybacterium phenoliresistens]EWS81756.1 hypothetical protein BF93_16280 [Brachybacterium phenoliresistens]
MTTHIRRGFAVTLAVLALAACGTAEPEAVPSPESTPAAVVKATTKAPIITETTEAATTTPTPTDPMMRALEISCHAEGEAGGEEFSSLEEAWAAPAEQRYSCDVDRVSRSQWMDVEAEAYEAAGYDNGDISTLYLLCAKPGLGYGGDLNTYSDGQQAELAAALVLCPDHPDAPVVRDRIEASIVEDRLIAEGRVFFDGTYRVGEDVQPGTYVLEREDSPVENCYWELLDEDGDIIDNNFISSAFRVEITVPSSAYSLTTEGCGRFGPAE